jgi:hypothetical protein
MYTNLEQAWGKTLKSSSVFREYKINDGITYSDGSVSFVITLSIDILTGGTVNEIVKRLQEAKRELDESVKKYERVLPMNLKNQEIKFKKVTVNADKEKVENDTVFLELEVNIETDNKMFVDYDDPNFTNYYTNTTTTPKENIAKMKDAVSRYWDNYF